MSLVLKPVVFVGAIWGMVYFMARRRHPPAAVLMWFGFGTIAVWIGAITYLIIYKQ